MNRKAFLAASAALLCLSSAAYAGEVVNYSLSASMPSLRDNNLKDTFEVTLSDAQIQEKLTVNCTAGRSKWYVLKTDEACGIAGSGAVVNPGTGQPLPRTQYAGGFVVKSDTGYVDAHTIAVNYLPLGKAPAASAQFGGSLVMKPENPSKGAKDIQQILINKVKGTSGDSVIDERIDSVELSRFFVTSAGLPSDQGCSWTGDMVYAYQTEAWSMKFTASCNGGKDEYKLTGNMVWSDNSDDEARYDLVLALPSANVNSDDALFAPSDGDNDLFAAADGIVGSITIKEGSFVTVKVQGADEELASQLDATGTFTGTNVPLPVVRSFATVFGLLSRTFYGA